MSEFECMLVLLVIVISPSLILSTPGERKLDDFRFIFYDEKLTYEEAKRFCECRDGWIAEPRHRDIEKLLMRFINGESLWIGLTRGDEGWIWGDGNRVKYSNWDESTSISTQNNCSRTRRGYGWSSASCLDKFPVACQFDTTFQGNYELTFVTDSPKNFRDATAACNASGSRLVDVKNSKLNDLIVPKLTYKGTYFYTSGNDIVTDGTWKWGDGCDFDERVFHDWLRTGWTEPNGNTGENCLGMTTFNKPNFWFDIECSKNSNYVCQQDIHGGLCNLTLCFNRGECTRRGKRYSCNCNIGYYGAKCEKDYCNPSPCKHSGTCQYSANSPYYSCNCTVEYTGLRCAKLLYRKFKGCQYHIQYSGHKRTYPKAIKFCKKGGGTLAMLKTSEIQNFIQNQTAKQYGIDGTKQFWFGIQKRKGVWSWEDNSTVPMTGPNQKWSNKDGNRAIMSSWKSKKVNDMLWYGKNSTHRIAGLVCERPVDGHNCHNYCRNNGSCTSIGCQRKCACLEYHHGNRCEHNKIQFLNISSAGSDDDDQLNISCHYRGKPVPDVKWIWRFRETTENISGMEQKKNKNFVIYNSKESDHVISTLAVQQREFLNLAEIGCYAQNRFESSKAEYITPNSDIHFATNFTYQLVNRSYNHSSALYGCKLRKRQLLQISNKVAQASITRQLASWNVANDVFVDWTKHVVNNSISWVPGYESTVYKENAGKSALPGIVEEMSWGQSQPASSAGDCVVLKKSDSWRWSVVNCTHRAMSVCQRPVLGPMKNFEVSSGECKPEIVVNFTSGHLVGELAHLLEIVNNGNRVFEKYYLPHSMENNAVIASVPVQNGTSYEVKLTVCPSCPAPFQTAVWTTTDTFVSPAYRRVFDFRVTQTGSNCVLNWDVNKTGVAGFQIKVSENPKVAYGGLMSPANKNVSISRNDRRFIVSTRPNSKYIFTAQVKTCTGIGPPGSPSGQCITDTEAPQTIGTPLVISGNDNSDVVPIRISVPDQRNGPISCIFIIVTVNASLPTTKRNISMDTIKKAMAKSSSAKTFSPGEEYLALAIPRSFILSKMGASGFIQQQLGDKNTTQCDASTINPSTRRNRRSLSKEVLMARNLPLDHWTKYSFTVASTTPGETIIYVQSSEPVKFTKSRTKVVSDQPSQIANGAIAGIVAAILAILLLVIIASVVVIKRRKAELQQNSAPDNVAMNVVEENNDFVYANLVMDAISQRSKTAISLDKLLSTYNDMSLDDKKKFREQYSNLKTEAKEMNYPTVVATNEAVKKMNRYKNVIPADHSRVVLKATELGYINASYIHSFDKAKKYIATQGPLPSTVEHFWWMVLEQKSTVIVMLTRCMEERKKKCEQYWPAQENTEAYGALRVKNDFEDNFGSFVIRTLTVETNDRSHTVKQVHFLTWPDHGVPATTTNLLSCHKEFSKLSSDAPIIVHCSAGAGRSGAFIAYDILKSEGKSTGSVDVYKCILKMRENRVDMVQTAVQFMLVHKLLTEDHVLGDTSVQADVLLNGYDWKRKSDKEFYNLSLIEPLDLQLTATQDAAFNRDQEVIPYMRNHVSVAIKSTEVVMPYINASFVESCDPQVKIIATQGPLESTQDMFWRCVLDHKAKTIVSLTTCYENNEEQSVMYWPDMKNDSLVFDDITVQLKSVSTKGKTICRNFNVCRNNIVLKVKHFQYLGWSSQNCPKNSNEVLELVKKVTARTQSEKNGSVLVHCSDGAGRTGAFCTILNLVMQSKRGEAIDVFRTAKDVRDCRPKMIRTLDQYQFCYQTILAHLSMNDVYSNVNQNVQSQEEVVYENFR